MIKKKFIAQELITKHKSIRVEGWAQLDATANKRSTSEEEYVGKECEQGTRNNVSLDHPPFSQVLSSLSVTYYISLYINPHTQICVSSASIQIRVTTLAWTQTSQTLDATFISAIII